MHSSFMCYLGAFAFYKVGNVSKSESSRPMLWFRRRLLFRSFARSAYAKLGMISSALSSDSDDVTKLLNVSLDLIAPASGDAPGGTKGQVGRLSTAAGTHEVSKTSGTVGDSERAVEVLSFLVSKTKVRFRTEHKSTSPRVTPQMSIPMLVVRGGVGVFKVVSWLSYILLSGCSACYSRSCNSRLSSACYA